MINTTDISDILVGSGGAPILPVRSEKQIVLTPRSDLETFYTTAARRTPLGMDYMYIRLHGRTPDKPGVYVPGQSMTYWFLINPSEVQATRQVLDSQAMTRSGWQIGLSGEDFLLISMTGKSAGRYAANGLTAVDAPESISYRNMMALELLFENNGYWFEGEEIHTALTSSQRSKRIKMHSDVELTVGDFIWCGMFENFEITEDAETPYIVDFNLTFIAWKETFRHRSPYPNSLGGDVQRGHVPLNRAVDVLLSANGSTQTSTLSLDSSNLTTLIDDPASGGFGQP